MWTQWLEVWAVFILVRYVVYMVYTCISPHHWHNCRKNSMKTRGSLATGTLWWTSSSSQWWIFTLSTMALECFKEGADDWQIRSRRKHRISIKPHSFTTVAHKHQHQSDEPNQPQAMKLNSVVFPLEHVCAFEQHTFLCHTRMQLSGLLYNCDPYMWVWLCHSVSDACIRLKLSAWTSHHLRLCLDSLWFTSVSKQHINYALCLDRAHPHTTVLVGWV